MEMRTLQRLWAGLHSGPAHVLKQYTHVETATLGKYGPSVPNFFKYGIFKIKDVVEKYISDVFINIRGTYD